MEICSFPQLIAQVLCALGTETSLIRQLPPLGSSRWPRFVGHYHEARLRLASLKARKKNFKKVTLQRRYQDTLEKAARYRNRERNWQFMGDNVSINQVAGYQAGKRRPSNSQRIAQSMSRAANNRPGFCPRSQGHRRNSCRPMSRND